MHEVVILIKYLGFPLFSARLRISDCSNLISKVHTRISNWTNQHLSYAGRLELLKSTINGLHIYWANAFLLPDACILQIEKHMRSFLWGDHVKKTVHTVAWEKICSLKSKGGFGLGRIKKINIACLMKKTWDIAFGKESLWIRWIHAKKTILGYQTKM